MGVSLLASFSNESLRHVLRLQLRITLQTAALAVSALESSRQFAQQVASHFVPCNSSASRLLRKLACINRTKPAFKWCYGAEHSCCYSVISCCLSSGRFAVAKVLGWLKAIVEDAQQAQFGPFSLHPLDWDPKLCEPCSSQASTPTDFCCCQELSRPQTFYSAAANLFHFLRSCHVRMRSCYFQRSTLYITVLFLHPAAAPF